MTHKENQLRFINISPLVAIQKKNNKKLREIKSCET